jgi:hypothetical protein
MLILSIPSKVAGYYSTLPVYYSTLPLKGSVEPAYGRSGPARPGNFNERHRHKAAELEPFEGFQGTSALSPSGLCQAGQWALCKGESRPAQ